MVDIINEWSVCMDCIQYIVNDDVTGLDYYLTEEQAEQKIAAMRQAISDLPEGQHPAMGGEDLGFCTTRCDCCGDSLHGDRYKLNILGGVMR